MNTLRLYPSITILAAFLLAIVGIFVPTPPHANPLEFHVPFFVTTIIAVIYIGSSLIFAHGLSSFKVGLKASYGLICAGVAVLGVAQLQLPIFYYFDLWFTALSSLGILQIPGITGASLLYAGSWLFAGLLDVNSKFRSILFLLIATLGISIAAMLLPHSASTNLFGDEFAFDYNVSLTVVTAMLTTFSAFLILRIKQKAGLSFTGALAWFFLAILFHSIANWQIIPFYLLGFDNWYILNGIFYLPWVFACSCLLKASIAFNKINQD